MDAAVSRRPVCQPLSSDARSDRRGALQYRRRRESPDRGGQEDATGRGEEAGWEAGGVADPADASATTARSAPVAPWPEANGDGKNRRGEPASCRVGGEGGTDTDPGSSPAGAAALGRPPAGAGGPVAALKLVDRQARRDLERVIHAARRHPASASGRLAGGRRHWRVPGGRALDEGGADLADPLSQGLGRSLASESCCRQVVSV